MSGFITTDTIPSQYGLNDTKTRRRGLNNSFFVVPRDKFIAWLNQPCVSFGTTEIAATRGSCGNKRGVNA